MKHFAILVVALVLSMLTTAARGQIAIEWSTVDGGGTTLSTAGSIELSGTIGQADAGSMGSGSTVFYGGFWAVELAPAPCPADYNQDGGVDGQDVDAFFADWETGEMVADVNQDGGVDGQDVQFFFEVWEAGGC
jgi:hypothetical protein